ncbi:MAG TPA: hypothetical protein VI749_09460 [Candidatus Omnitrophota bacterium]|nr:hypothetical protein [Candidatus Omnitrophota bacterium]
MEPFNLVSEAVIFIAVFSIVVMLPCYFVVMIGRDMIDQIGQFPTMAARIQLKALFKLVAVELVSFFLLIAFYRVFAH